MKRCPPQKFDQTGWKASLPLLFFFFFLGIPTAIAYALPSKSQQPAAVSLLQVGINAIIPPEEFNFSDTISGGNGQILQLSANAGEAIAQVHASNEQGVEATAVVGVDLDFDPAYPSAIGNAVVRVEVDFEYQIDARPDPLEGSALAEVAVEPGVANFVASQTNGMDQQPVTYVFTTTVGELPPTLLFRATATALAGDPGEFSQSQANARINVGQVRLLFNPDIIAVALEVTQGLQNLDNSVDLIANKPTYVRLYAFVFRPQDSGIKTAAQLRVTKGGAELLLDPINASVVKNKPVRAQLQDSYLFQLPNNFTSGAVTLKGEINHTNNGRVRAPDEMLVNNNEVETTVTFNSASPLNLTIIDMRYRQCTGCTLRSIGATDVSRMVDWLSVGYPVPSVNYRSRTYEMRTTNPDSADVLRDVRKIRRSEISDNSRNRCSVYIGLADDVNGTNFIRGLADIGDYVAMSPAGATFRGSGDLDGSYADWYGAHELGHALGRKHVACRGEVGTDANFPHLSTIKASISQVASNDPYEQTYGFNWKHRRGATAAPNIQIYDQNYREVMSYCQAQWVSEYTYAALRTEIGKLAANCATPIITGTNYLLVSGLISVTDHITTAALDPLYILPTVVVPTLDPAGWAEIVLRNSAENELARYPFIPIEISSDSLNPNGEGATTERYLIDELVPYVAGTVRVEIETAAGVIAQITTGANDPTISVTGPARSASALQTITWTANDLDGDDLQFIVQYSPDSGQTWQTLAVDVTDNAFTVDSDTLPSGIQARYRVLASDGIHTAVADSEVFVVANHLPSAEISTPAHNSSIATRQTIGLTGLGYDADSGSLDDSALSWSSSRDGALGTGSSLAVSALSVGTHTLTLSVTDSAGSMATDQISVTVVETVDQLPSVPSQLAIAPNLLALDSVSLVSGTVVIDSSGSETLNWTATASETWLLLAPLSGTTGGAITVTLDDSDLSNDIHSGTITVTNSADSNDQHFITVIYDKSNVPTSIATTTVHTDGIRSIFLIVLTTLVLTGFGSIWITFRYDK
jgi:hypothetical protein